MTMNQTATPSADGSGTPADCPPAPAVQSCQATLPNLVRHKS